MSYLLEIHMPATGMHAWDVTRFEQRPLDVASDELAADEVFRIVSESALVAPDGSIRYARPTVCLNRLTSRGIALPWSRIHALPTTMPVQTAA